MAGGLDNILTVGRKLYRLNGRYLVSTNCQTLDFLPESKDRSFNLFSQPAPFGGGRGMLFVIEAKGWLSTEYRTSLDLLEVGPYTRFEFDAAARHLNVLVNFTQLATNEVYAPIVFGVNPGAQGRGNISGTLHMLRRPMLGGSDLVGLSVRAIKLFPNAELNANPKPPEILALNAALVAAFPIGSQYHPSLLPPGWESVV